jgi:enolase
MAKNSKIKSIKAREILDSRGNPTVEVELATGFGKFLASVPSGASKGKYEAVELRDGGKRYFGKGVLKAVRNVNEIIGPKLIGMDPTRQKEIDELMIELDGTENKSKLGANAICPVSLAVCRAGAATKNIPLYQYIKEVYRGQTSVKLAEVCPQPAFNIINGGVHAGNDLDIQEFMISPKGKSFSENLRIGVEIYHRLKEIISKKYGKLATNLGDEGGFAPPIKFPEEAIELILDSARKLNYENKIKLILDVASSQFFENGKYKMKTRVFTSQGLMRYYEKLIKNYPI